MNLQSKNGKAAIGAIGIIAIAFTLAFFFLMDIEPIAVNIWALIFVILSEIVFFGGLMRLRNVGADHNLVFLRAGFVASLSIYLSATLISAFFTGAFRDRLNIFILIQLAIIAVFLVAAIVLYTSSRNITRRNLDDELKVGTKEPKRGNF